MKLQRASRALLQVEPLEDRRLLAGNIAFDSSTGIIAVTGTPAADFVRASVENGSVVVRLIHAPTGVVAGRGTFSATQVRGLNFDGLDGDDCFLNDLAVPSTAHGGNGNDYLEGGAAADRLFGDAGNDVLVGFTGDDWAYGGEGNDRIFGTGGNDRLYGQGGADALYGGSGTDRLRDRSDFRDGRGDGPLFQLADERSQKFRTQSSAAAVRSSTAAELEAAVLALTNQERQRAGLAPLRLNPRLQNAARHHAANMARLNRLAHTLAEADLPDLAGRLSRYGYSYLLAGENVAWNYASASAVMAAWMGSPAHRANILNPTFTEIGVAVASNARGEPYLCQVFGAPV